MRTSRATAIAVAASASAFLLAGVAPASASVSASAGRQIVPLSWHVSYKIARSGQPQFSAVTATSATSAWAFDTIGGGAPGAYHFSGSHWSKATFPSASGDFVAAAASSSASNVWAFTFQGQALRYNGSSWSKVKKFSQPIGSGLAMSSTDVWVFGEVGFGANLGTYHFNGSSWTKSTSGSGLAGASALSASSIWAYGGTNVAHWNGHSWKKTSVASLLPKNTKLSHSFLNGIYAASATSVYAVGSGGRQDEGGPLVLLHYNGATWSQVALVSKLGGPAAVVPDGSGGLWIPVMTGFPGDGSMEHYSSGALHSFSLPISPRHLALFGAASGHSTTAFAVGYSRTSFSSSNTTAVILRYGS